jgi:hypothetical protein
MDLNEQSVRGYAEVMKFHFLRAVKIGIDMLKILKKKTTF